MTPQYKHIFAFDTEFTAPEGERPTPICVSAIDILTGKVYSSWLSGEQCPEAPYPINDDVLMTCYNAVAEASVHLALGWEQPQICDLYIEFCNLVNGSVDKGKGTRTFAAACNYFGIKIDVMQKEAMQKRCIEGSPFSESEKEAIQSYNLSDTMETALLFKKMWKYINATPNGFLRSLLRGNYMWCVAVMEREGIPIDTITYNKFIQNWDRIRPELIKEVDATYGVYEKGVFKMALFEKYLARNNIPWGRTKGGALQVNDEYFKDMVKTYPQLSDLRDLRGALSQLSKKSLVVGTDGNNRTSLFPFASLTSRNQPSSTKYIFGNSKWMRSLIKPKEGMAIAYIDYEQQEWGLAAALSGDKNMKLAYESGDPYMSFAIQSGMAPEGATKQTHGAIRDVAKTSCLALNYSMGVKSLAERINKPEDAAKNIWNAYKRTFSTYEQYSQEVCDTAIFTGKISTLLGWTYDTRNAKRTTLVNYPQQSNGGEMLRVAVCNLVKNGIKVCGTAHDAVLISDTCEGIEKTVGIAQVIMERSSEDLIGLKIRTEPVIVKYPDRYLDKNGLVMWNTVNEVLSKIEGGGEGGK